MAGEARAAEQADAARRRRRRAAAVVAGMLALAVLAALGGALIWANTYPRGPLFDPIADLPEPLPAEAAERNGRRIAVVFADTQDFWARALGREAAGYASARFVLFTRGTGTPCAPGATTAGPFYCAESGSAAFDLLFFEALGQRLRREADLGTALVVAHVAAAHTRGRLDPGRAGDPRAEALISDCLAGVWAAARRGRIGEVAPGFYGRMLQTARNTAGDLARIGPPIRERLDPFRPGRIPDREAAFQAGYRTVDPAVCPLTGTRSAAR